MTSWFRILWSILQTCGNSVLYGSAVCFSYEHIRKIFFWQLAPALEPLCCFLNHDESCLKRCLMFFACGSGPGYHNGSANATFKAKMVRLVYIEFPKRGSPDFMMLSAVTRPTLFASFKHGPLTIVLAIHAVNCEDRLIEDAVFGEQKAQVLLPHALGDPSHPQSQRESWVL